MLAYVLQHNERFLIDRADPFWQHIASFKWWLLPHGLAGACALLLGPMQFWQGLRQRYLKLHRVLGRIYVVGALTAAPIGVYIQYRDQRMGSELTFTLAALTFAMAWMITTATGFVFAFQRKIQQHRQWMTRSYAFALVFLEVRVISGLGGWDADNRIGEAIVWICVAAAPLLADFALQWQDSREKLVAAKASAVR